MTKYIFIHKDDHNGAKTYSSVQHVTCTDIVRAFVSFLLACTFHRNTVISGLKDITEELENE